MGLILATVPGMLRGRTAALLFLALAAAPSTDAQTLELAAPQELNDGWPVAPPLSAGFNEARLADLTRRLLTGEYLTMNAIVVEHDGALVYEHYQSAEVAFLSGSTKVTDYGPTTRLELYSASMSVTALVLGIVLEGQEEVNRDTPVLSLLPDTLVPTDPAAYDITIEDALTMSAGLSWNEFVYRPSDDKNKVSQLFRRTDPLEYLFDQPMSDAPGERFSYNTGLTVALSAVITNLEGRPFGEVATDTLFRPLGITLGGLSAVRPWGNNGGSTTAVAMTMSVRDLAKIGSLMLHAGQWQGTQIVPAEWITLSSRVYRVDADNDLYDNYGYHWWFRDFIQGGRTFPAIVARGLGGQRVFVLPEQNMVVTMLASHTPDQRWMSERLLLEILAALD